MACAALGASSTVAPSSRLRAGGRQPCRVGKVSATRRGAVAPLGHRLGVQSVAGGQGAGGSLATLGSRLEHAASQGLRREDLLPLTIQGCTITGQDQTVSRDPRNRDQRQEILHIYEQVSPQIVDFQCFAVLARLMQIS